MIKYYDRRSKSYEIEKVAGENMLKWSYESPIGKGFLELLVKRKLFSKFYGHYCDTKLSSKKIKSFVKGFNMNMDEYEKSIDEYTSFNDFFYRKLKPTAREINKDKNIFISPSDSRLLSIDNIDENHSFKVKGFDYSLKEILGSKELADKYKGGICLIFRLCPTDYHRFHFIDNGTCSSTTKIKGNYYSVSPIALEKVSKVFTSNKREYSILHSENFGDLLYLEVGATCVGGIIQTYKENSKVYKGDEKGFFKFGGSTVIILVEKDKLKLDEDIIYHSKKDIEVIVKMGEKIGVRI
ncbi:MULTISPECIES: phosphatidylserine decarboxylase [unclassified Clostridium]|uniref:phosphatidylserine decarboxylase n=1 Tax=unclassified Clostridium TaxID=2614128 RepID=UPI0025C61D42|nr:MULTISPECIES: phosphatidylserine decarboxylase [unclassified Clostridium]